MTLCATRPAEWWETGDEGNRLAMLLCAVCPMRSGEECRAGQPDPAPHGVIRAGVAYSDAGNRLPVCECGYPMVGYRGGGVTRCRRCLGLPPSVEPERRVGQVFDESTVERLLSGNPPPIVRPVDKREALRRLWASGMSHPDVAARLGMSVRAVEQAKYRMTWREAAA